LAEHLFEAMDLAADRRVRQEEILTRPSDAPLLRPRQEVEELVEIEPLPLATIRRFFRTDTLELRRRARRGGRPCRASAGAIPRGSRRRSPSKGGWPSRPRRNRAPRPQ